MTTVLWAISGWAIGMLLVGLVLRRTRMRSEREYNKQLLEYFDLLLEEKRGKKRLF